MVTLVYYGDDFSKAAGESLLCGLHCDEPQWINQDLLTVILNAGQTVTIRPATFVEFLEAESTFALAKIEMGASEYACGTDAAETPNDVRH